VTDQEDRSLPVKEESFQRLTGVHVQVVCRLVQEKEVRWKKSEDGQFESTPLATREHGHLLIHLVAAEEEASEVPACNRCFNGDRGAKRFNHGGAVETSGAYLREIRRDYTLRNLNLAAEWRKDPSDALQKRGLPRTIRTDDANPLAPTECDALRAGDDASRRLAISNLCLHQAHGLCGTSTRTCGRDREACPALRCDHWLNRRQPALMLVHLAVLPMASIRLDQLALSCDLLRPSLGVSLCVQLSRFALLRICRVVPTESRDGMVANLPDSIHNGIKE
jgi:hypothetical protein